MKKIIRQIIFCYKRNKFRKHCWKNDQWMIQDHQLPELTEEEMASIRDTWPCFAIDKRDLAYVRMYKKEYGFSPYFISDYQYQTILDTLNPIAETIALDNKAMYDMYFPTIPQVPIYTRRIRGLSYDEKMQNITRDEEVRILSQYISFIIKPSKNTGCGVGVRKIDLSQVEEKNKFLNDLLDSYGTDYVVQKVIIQHPNIAKFNARSLNTCRVTSLYLNGKFTCSTILKIGKQSSDIDNWNSSYIIGVNDDGTLKTYGYDNRLHKVSHSDNGESFEGTQLPCFDKMILKVQYFHQHYFPHLGIVGWDVCIDSENHFCMIEVNLDCPGVAGEQFASGTFFQERRHEIVQEIMKHIK